MLEAINLTKQYGNKYALKNLNLSVKSGEVFCLLGQNGAGKTTTINLFLGLISADTIDWSQIKPVFHLAEIPVKPLDRSLPLILAILLVGIITLPYARNL